MTSPPRKWFSTCHTYPATITRRTTFPPFDNPCRFKLSVTCLLFQSTELTLYQEDLDRIYGRRSCGVCGFTEYTQILFDSHFAGGKHELAVLTIVEECLAKYFPFAICGVISEFLNFASKKKLLARRAISPTLNVRDSIMWMSSQNCTIRAGALDLVPKHKLKSFQNRVKPCETLRTFDFARFRKFSQVFALISLVSQSFSSLSTLLSRKVSCDVSPV